MASTCTALRPLACECASLIYAKTYGRTTFCTNNRKNGHPTSVHRATPSGHYDHPSTRASRPGHYFRSSSPFVLQRTKFARHRKQSPHDRASIERIQQLRSRSQCFPGLCVGHPLPTAFVHFRPFCLLFLNGNFKKLEHGFGCL